MLRTTPERSGSWAGTVSADSPVPLLQPLLHMCGIGRSVARSVRGLALTGAQVLDLAGIASIVARPAVFPRGGFQRR